MQIVQPRWSSWTFLVYAGGFTVLGSAAAWLSYFASRFGSAAYAGWALVVASVLAALAVWFRRSGRWIPAGVFAFAAVVAVGALIAALWIWFGWLSPSSAGSGFHGFHPGRIAAELLWTAAALTALAVFRFPLLVSQVTLGVWLAVTDILSGGGSWSAAVAILVGMCFLGSGLLLDLGSTRPFGFWLHVAAGLTIGGGLIYFWHSGNVEWALVAIAAVGYVLFAGVAGRSSWAVLGTIGLLAAAGHFAIEWTHVQLFFFDAGGGSGRAWMPPLVYAVAGFLIVGLGLALARRPADQLPTAE